MTDIAVVFVDLYALRQGAAGLEALCLRRSAAGRCPGSWETVHGSIEPGETPADAALRELREETGLVPERLYNLSRVESFYLHRRDLVSLIPVFVAFTAAAASVRLSAEHDGFEWLPLAAARQRLAWPRERRALDDVSQLLGSGGAAELEDVLRVK